MAEQLAEVDMQMSETGRRITSYNVCYTKLLRSVTMEEIIGCQVHTYIAPKTIPKSPQGGGSEPATLDKTDMVITAEPELHPPFTEVAENNYLDVFDEF